MPDIIEQAHAGMTIARQDVIGCLSRAILNGRRKIEPLFREARA